MATCLGADHVTACMFRGLLFLFFVLYLFVFLFTCLCECPAHVCWCLQRPERVPFFGAEVIGVASSLTYVLGIDLHPLEVQQMLLAFEPFLQPQELGCLSSIYEKLLEDFNLQLD